MHNELSKVSRNWVKNVGYFLFFVLLCFVLLVVVVVMGMLLQAFSTSKFHIRNRDFLLSMYVTGIETKYRFEPFFPYLSSISYAVFTTPHIWRAVIVGVNSLGWIILIWK